MKPETHCQSAVASSLCCHCPSHSTSLRVQNQQMNLVKYCMQCKFWKKKLVKVAVTTDVLVEGDIVTITS